MKYSPATVPALKITITDKGLQPIENQLQEIAKLRRSRLSTAVAAIARLCETAGRGCLLELLAGELENLETRVETRINEKWMNKRRAKGKRISIARIEKPT